VLGARDILGDRAVIAESTRWQMRFPARRRA